MTARPQRSKSDLTSRLIDSAVSSWARRISGAKRKTIAQPSRRILALPREKSERLANLKIESWLITHRKTVEHVARRRRGPVSVGAFIDLTVKRRFQSATRECGGRAEVQFSIQICGRHDCTIAGRDIDRLRSLINFKR